MAKCDYIMNFLRIFNRHHKTSIINTSVQQHRSTLTITKNRARQRGLFLDIIPNNRQKEQLQIIIFGWCLVFFSSSCEHSHHGGSNNHERSNTRVSSDGKYEGLGEPNSDKPREAPNGLNNNRLRCYANAALQLLAACFSEEIKSMRPFGNGDEKEQIRLNLCTIVDHINAPEKRSPGDKKVLQSVQNLTGQDKDDGGCADGFLIKLVGELGLYPGCELELYTCQDTFKLENSNISNLISEDLPQRQEVGFLNLPNWSEIVYNYYREGMSLAMLWKHTDFSWQFENDQVLKKYFELKSQNSINWILFEEFKEFKERMPDQYVFWYKNPAYYKVSFTKLKKKLPTGAKLLTLKNGRKHYKELALPYGERPEHWQKFDLAGFIVRSGWHFFTCIKREGTWYKANDSIISMLSEKEIDNELNKCCDLTGNMRIVSVYKAKD